MNTEINIPFEEIFANRKYLTNQAKKILFDHMHLGTICKELVLVLESYATFEDSALKSTEANNLRSNIIDTFDEFMDKIQGIAEYQRIRNRLSKFKAEKKQKSVKQPKIEESILFQLDGFAFQLGALKGEKISTGQALKFLLDHAVNIIHLSKA